MAPWLRDCAPFSLVQTTRTEKPFVHALPRRAVLTAADALANHTATRHTGMSRPRGGEGQPTRVNRGLACARDGWRTGQLRRVDEGRLMAVKLRPSVAPAGGGSAVLASLSHRNQMVSRRDRVDLASRELEEIPRSPERGSPAPALSYPWQAHKVGVSHSYGGRRQAASPTLRERAQVSLAETQVGHGQK